MEKSKANALGSLPGDTRHFTNAPTFSQYKRYLLHIEAHTLRVPENTLSSTSRWNIATGILQTMQEGLLQLRFQIK